MLARRRCRSSTASCGIAMVKGRMVAVWPRRLLLLSCSRGYEVDLGQFRSATPRKSRRMLKPPAGCSSCSVAPVPPGLGWRGAGARPARREGRTLRNDMERLREPRLPGRGGARDRAVTTGSGSARSCRPAAGRRRGGGRGRRATRGHGVSGIEETSARALPSWKPSCLTGYGGG